MRYWQKISKPGTIVFDTNALISAAILKNSTTAEAFDLAIIDFKIIFLFDTLFELQNVLFRKKFDKYIFDNGRNLFLNYFLIHSFEIEVTSVISDCRDPKDNKFLELAIDGQAEYIVTGDKDLLVLHPYHDISIVNPSMFLEKFTSE